LVASESAQGSFARIDVRAGRMVYPSRWASELFDGGRADVPSFAGSLRRVSDGLVPAADATDFELASMSEASARRSAQWLDRLDPDYGRRRASLVGRRSDGLNPFAGYVPASGQGPDEWSAVMSATSLESFAKCPFRYFLEKKLLVSVLDAPEQLIQIDARVRGTMMHEVLEGYFRPGEEPWTVTVFDDAQLRRLRSLANEQFERFEAVGKVGKALFWETERSRILRDLERYAASDVDSLASGGLVPIAVELRFGADRPPLVMKAAGREVSFTGSIDRVDRAPDGRLVVVDYKSGKSWSYKGIAGGDPLGRGRHLQLPIYAKAAQEAYCSASGGMPQVRAEYRFVQAIADYEIVPVELTDELDAELSEVLETLVSTIDAGCFPPRPGKPGRDLQHENCQYCDFDALCTLDRGELWERAAGDPQMKPYTDLVTGTDGRAGSSHRGNVS
jgi:CRISPR/Cas system-associated exonuclease Cas4 (RecB family)